MIKYFIDTTGAYSKSKLLKSKENQNLKARQIKEIADSYQRIEEKLILILINSSSMLF